MNQEIEEELRLHLQDRADAFPPASKWTASAPAPDLLSGTIVRTAPELEAQLEKRS
jgi:hypothetical protein